MKRVIWGLIALVLLAGAVVAAQAKQDFTLVNKTGLDINEIYLSPTDDDEWGEDVLDQDILKDGAKVHITFSRKAKSCKWDLKVIDEDDDPIVWENIDLCKASEITLKYEGKKPTAIIK